MLNTLIFKYYKFCKNNTNTMMVKSIDLNTSHKTRYKKGFDQIVFSFILHMLDFYLQSKLSQYSYFISNFYDFYCCLIHTIFLLVFFKNVFQ